jgi:hypothetical protein
MLLLFSDVFGQNFVAHVQSTAHFSFWQLAHQPPSDLRGRPLQSDLSNRTSPIGPFRASSEDAVFVRCSRVEIAAARIAALPELVLLACCFGCSLQLRRRFCSNAARKVSSVTLCGAAGSGSCLALAGRLAPRCAGRQSGALGVRLASGEVLAPRVTASGHSRPLPVTVLLNCSSFIPCLAGAQHIISRRCVFYEPWRLRMPHSRRSSLGATVRSRCCGARYLGCSFGPNHSFVACLDSSPHAPAPAAGWLFDVVLQERV